MLWLVRNSTSACAQRLDWPVSEHASVSVYNVILSGTFEEYIVGRLMEKLQTISHAIGDVEALLEASGMTDGEEDGPGGFEEQIRKLVIDSLAGKDVTKATRLAEESISEAKATLEAEERTINDMLGGMDDVRHTGPRSPSLPPAQRSMPSAKFTLAALKTLGAHIGEHTPGIFSCRIDGQQDLISTAETPSTDQKGIIQYAPGTSAFERLVARITQSGTHDVRDADKDALKEAKLIAQQWLETFGGQPKGMRVVNVARCFEGSVLVQARATVAHDGYERLVEVPCQPGDHRSLHRSTGLGPLSDVIEDPALLGLKTEPVAEAVLLDPGISEFRRFYLERRAEEINAGRGDPRKQKKLEDDFTPRLEATVVGMHGTVHRELTVHVSYGLDETSSYESTLKVAPATRQLIAAPEFASCTQTQRTVPIDCVAKCEISGATVIKHLLVPSEISGRVALPQHTLRCELSAKRILSDEAEASAITGRLVAKSLLKTSSLSGRRAEPEKFQTCEFTQSNLLLDEVLVSEVSGKRYRSDQQGRSDVTGKNGHSSEFLICSETGKMLLASEGERCAVTGKFVIPGLLEECSVTHMRVLPSELERSSVSGRKSLRKFFVASSFSGVRILEVEAVTSSAGLFCTQEEARPCLWSSQRCHPTDLRRCAITGVPFHFKYATISEPAKLQTLVDLLDRTAHATDASEAWPQIAEKAAAIVRGKYKIEAAQFSPDRRHLAATAEVRTIFGFRSQIVGFICSLENKAVVGHIAQGKRTPGGWMPS